MSEPTLNSEPNNPDTCSLSCIAEELQRQSEKLQAIAEQLKAKEESQSEMVAKYPHFEKFVRDKMVEHFERTLEPLPEGVDLEAYAREQGGLPFEAFFDQMLQEVRGT
jgi:hypothetical protein